MEAEAEGTILHCVSLQVREDLDGPVYGVSSVNHLQLSGLLSIKQEPESAIGVNLFEENTLNCLLSAFKFLPRGKCPRNPGHLVIFQFVCPVQGRPDWLLPPQLQVRVECGQAGQADGRSPCPCPS